MMRHALVTGGAGFIGSHLVDRLLAEGWRVTVVDNFDPFYDPAIKEANIKPHLENPNYRLVRADIRDLETLRLELRDYYDVIVHLAAKAGVRPSFKDSITYQEVNLQGTRNMLEIARSRNVPQFIFGSSSSVYGVNPNVPWREDEQDLRPISPYALTKLGGEQLCQMNCLLGLRVVVLRFFTVYGPRQRPDLAIHKFARLMLEGKPIPVYGDGSSRRDYTYIDDIIQGVRAAMDYTATPYEVINLGNNRTVSLMEMIRALEETLGVKAELDFLPPQPGDVPQTWADVGKGERLLNYQPTTPIIEGLRAFAAWL